jgi:hypothetical protein
MPALVDPEKPASVDPQPEPIVANQNPVVGAGPNDVYSSVFTPGIFAYSHQYRRVPTSPTVADQNGDSMGLNRYFNFPQEFETMRGENQTPVETKPGPTLLEIEKESKLAQTELENTTVELFNRTAEIFIENTAAFRPFLKTGAEFFTQYLHKADSCGSTSKKLVLKHGTIF